MKIKIAQWNIGSVFFRSRIRGNDKFPYSLFHKNRLKFIKRSIEFHDPDLILLQEYLSGDFDVNNYPYNVVMKKLEYATNTAIFSKLPITEISTNPVAGFCSAKIGNIHLVSLHWKPWSSRDRFMQAKKLKEYLVDKKAIVVGDFNILQFNGWFILSLDKLSWHIITSNDYACPKSFDRSIFGLDYCIAHKYIRIKKLITKSNWLNKLQSSIDHKISVFEYDGE